MSKYHQTNKAAWEEAYDQASKRFLERTKTLLKTNPKALFSKEMTEILSTLGGPGKTLGQFCCNNGRETMAALSFGFDQTVGFDIATNMTKAANVMAKDMGFSAYFHDTDIFEIKGFDQAFDVLIITVGALTWFENLMPFFKKAKDVLKPGGMIVIEEIHPFSNMLAIEGEEGFDPLTPKKIIHSYYKDTPWIEADGMGYMTEKSGVSKPFVSFSHTFMDVINGLTQNQFMINELQEIDVDSAGMFEVLSKTGVPLTMIIRATRL
jgi:SAM-dependent methyltransferase